MIRFLGGDCRDVLKTLPDRSVQCVVTSPPFFGLRDYGTAEWVGGDLDCRHIEVHPQNRDGRTTPGGRGGTFPTSERAYRSICPKCGAKRIDSQIGLESTPALYVAEMVAVFREVWRVLRDDGTCWANFGDSYATGTTAPRKPTTTKGADVPASWAGRSQPERIGTPVGLKTKDLMMIPARVAIALCDDGWYLRKDIIWAKPNPMPESCTDRPTSSHEHIFLLAKSGASLFWTHRDGGGSRTQPAPDYRWIVRDTGEEFTEPPPGVPLIGNAKCRRVNLWSGRDYFYDAEAVREEGAIPAGTLGAKGSPERAAQPGVNSRPPEYKVYSGTRNLRDVWTIATQPFSEAHFATFPPELVERCVKAGTSERGACPACGAPWTRMVEKSRTFESGSGRSGNMPIGKNGPGMQGGGETGDIRRGPCVKITTTGWTPTCECPPTDPVPCVVLDPFSGAGTTALVADRLGRDAIGIDLNPAYGSMARERLVKDAGMFAVFE